MNPRNKKLQRAIIEAQFNLSQLQMRMEKVQSILQAGNDKEISDTTFDLLNDIESKIFDIIDGANESWHRDGSNKVVCLDTYRARKVK